ncbi:MAG: hypothetical protein JKY85_00105 [Porticoccus sp.]|nr:hypothetical protein [Porticoccus sp.]
MSGDISCFKDADRSIALFYWTTATLLIEGKTPSLQTEKLTEVKNWNSAVQMELLYSQDEKLNK